MTKLQIVITGANGFIATNLRRFLITSGFEVIGIARHNYPSSKFEKKIISKNYDPKFILPKIKDSNCIIHLVGIGKTSAHTDFNQTNLDLTKRIIHISKKSKIKKIIFLSGLGVSPHSTISYFISKYLAERQIVNSEIDYTIFRPSYVIGKNDYLTKNLTKQIKTGKVIIPGNGKYLIQPISIHDACKIITHSIADKRYSKKILDLVGPQPITFENYVKKFLSKKSLIQKIPLEKVFYNSINNLDERYDIDDLMILLGSFTGDYNRLNKISGFMSKNIP